MPLCPCLQISEKQIYFNFILVSPAVRPFDEKMPHIHGTNGDIWRLGPQLFGRLEGHAALLEPCLNATSYWPWVFTALTYIQCTLFFSCYWWWKMWIFEIPTPPTMLSSFWNQLPCQFLEYLTIMVSYWCGTISQINILFPELLLKRGTPVPTFLQNILFVLDFCSLGRTGLFIEPS